MDKIIFKKVYTFLIQLKTCTNWTVPDLSFQGDPSSPSPGDEADSSSGPETSSGPGPSSDLVVSSSVGVPGQETQGACGDSFGTLTDLTLHQYI